MNKLEEINQLITQIVHYGIDKKLIKTIDASYIANQVYNYIGFESQPIESETIDENVDIYKILECLYGLVIENHEETLSYEKDNFFADIMNLMLDKPSYVNHKFWRLYKRKSPEVATAYFYNYSQNSTYIRTDRIKKNIQWETHTPYGDLEITINLSKPEKDPKAIALAKKQKTSDYPKCLLCKEHVGHKGQVNMPSRQNHRTIECHLNNDAWHLQYSPYVYYNEHAIILCQNHKEMVLDKNSLINLFDFVDLFPHYFIGSNADLPIVGGSILSHDHYQGGYYEFPIMNAESIYQKKVGASIELEILKWPVSVVRLKSTDREALIQFGDKIMTTWKNYSDEELNIIAHSHIENEKVRHNTVTPILRRQRDIYELYLALRNNRCDDEHPMGIFHPHSEHHHIKKENIGLIEVMGLAILPGRLKKEIAFIVDFMNNVSLDEPSLALIEKHREWIDELKKKHPGKVKKEDIEQLVGLKFMSVLENAGVYKQNGQGLKGFNKFVETII